MRKIVGVIVVLVLCLLAVMAGQAVWLHVRLGDTGAGGRMVDVGGRRLHLLCMGAGGPTYVLEAGAAGFVEMWQRVQAALAARARVCAYDRAGLGASDPAGGGVTLDRVRRDLKAALDVAGEKGPFILVGHSLGGIFVRGFAAAYPDDVAALVLLDPVHEDQLAKFDEATLRYFETVRGMMRVIPYAARLGLLHLWNPLGIAARGLDGADRARALLYLQSPQHLGSASAEMEAWDTIMDEVRRSPPATSIPTLVLTAGAVPGRSAAMQSVILALHRDLAGQAAAGSHGVVDGADHFTILTGPEIAPRVVRMIQDFVARARGG